MTDARRLFGFSLLCSALASTSQLLAADGPKIRDPVEVREFQECRRNLGLIYEAIQAYRRVHRDIPNHLAELVPHFLSDSQWLTCPTSQRLGMSSQDAAKWQEASRTTYTYEFGPEPIPSIISGGSPRTMREWKRLQMGLVGSEVPMVRCLAHERAVLNLSFGGRIYESKNLDWEPLFDDKVQLGDLTFARALAQDTIQKKVVVPGRDSRAGEAQIDLSAYYTDLLDESWPEQWPLRPLASLSVGVREFNGTLFDVRGVVQLGAVRSGLVPYPTVVSNVAIALPVRKLTLLLGTRHAIAWNSPVASFVFHFPDGRTRRLSILYGRHVLTCLSKNDEVTIPLRDGQLAWRSELGEGRAARLYQCEWMNPSGQSVISTIDFVAEPGDSGPFLVALTVEPQR